MRIITKYILREHISPFLFSLITIVFVFLLNIIFRDLGRLLGKGIPVIAILEFFFLNMAWIAALAVPMSVLVATLMAFGRLSQDNEITALKAGGVNLYRLIRPVFLVSLALTFGMERFNNIVLPEFNYRVKQLYTDISRKQPTATIEPNVFFDAIENYTLLVNRIDRQRLEGILLTDSSDPRYTRTVIAREGDLRFVEAEDRMILDLREGEIHEAEQADLENYRRSRFERQIFSIPTHNMRLERTEPQHRGDREKSAAMMREDVERYSGSLEKNRDQIRRRVGTDLDRVIPRTAREKDTDSLRTMAGRPQQTLSMEAHRRNVQAIVHQIGGERGGIQAYRNRINSARVEIHKKYSIPVACMVFVLIGAPLGIMARHGGLSTGVGMSIVFFLIYWAFLIGGEQLGDRGYVSPAMAMWSPNLLVGGAGIFLVLRTVKEATFIPWETWKQAAIRPFGRFRRCAS